jgi:hypothetical protein
VTGDPSSKILTEKVVKHNRESFVTLCRETAPDQDAHGSAERRGWRSVFDIVDIAGGAASRLLLSQIRK